MKKQVVTRHDASMDSSSLDSESVGKKESWEEADRRFKALLQQGTLTPHEKQMLDEAVGSATTYGLFL